MPHCSRKRSDPRPLRAADALDRGTTLTPLARLRQGYRLAMLLLALALAAPRAHADTNAAEREKARAMASQGFDALQAKDYATAEELFRKADAIVHAPTLVVDHARSLVGLGRLVEAHERYALVLREGVPDTAPWQWKRALEDAEKELAELEPRLAWLTITVRGPRKPLVTIDGRRVPDAALGVRRATNPGKRVIRVRADGYLPADRNVALKEGDAGSIEVVLARDPAAPLAATETEEEPAPEVVVISTPSGPKPTDRTLDYVLLSAGGVGIVVGAVTGILALQVRKDLNATCPAATCYPGDGSEYSDYRQKVNRYRGLGTASGVAFGAGATAAVAGAVLFLFTGKSEKPAPSETSSKASSLKALVGPTSFGLSGTF